MSITPASSTTINPFLISTDPSQILGADLSTSDSTSTDSTSGLSSAQLSQPAQLFSKLQELLATNPTEATSILSQLSQQLQATAQSSSDPQAAKVLSSLAAKFATAAQTGDLSVLQPPSSRGSQSPADAYSQAQDSSSASQALVHGHHHHGHHHASSASDSSQSGSSSESSNSDSSDSSGSTLAEDLQNFIAGALSTVESATNSINTTGVTA